MLNFVWSLPKPIQFLIALLGSLVLLFIIAAFLFSAARHVPSLLAEFTKPSKTETGLNQGEAFIGERNPSFVKSDYIFTEWSELSPERRQELRAEAYVLFPELLAPMPNWQRITNWLQDVYRVDVRRTADAFNVVEVENLPDVYGTMLADIEVIGNKFRELEPDYIGKYWNVPQVSRTLYFRFEQWRELAEPLAQQTLGASEGRNFMINVMIGVRQPAPGDPTALQPIVN